jgi:hypothetical protein
LLKDCAGAWQRRTEVSPFLSAKTKGDLIMRYLIAWVLGVPGIVVVIWFLMSHH